MLLLPRGKRGKGIILDDDTPDVLDEAPLRIRGKRAKPDDGSEVFAVQTKKQRMDKFEATNPENIPASAPKRKRGKGDSSMIKDAASEAYAKDWDAKAEEPKAKKPQLTRDEDFSLMFVMTPEMTKQADEQARKML